MGLFETIRKEESLKVRCLKSEGIVLVNQVLLKGVGAVGVEHGKFTSSSRQKLPTNSKIGVPAAPVPECEGKKAV